MGRSSASAPAGDGLPAIHPVVHMIALVLAGELINSSIEALADHLHPQQHPAIGRVKDLAAGMVLVTSIAAMIVGLLALWANR